MKILSQQIHLETMLEKYRIITSISSSGIENRAIIGTNVYLIEKGRLVFLDTYRTVKEAAKKHFHVVDDVQKHPEKYTVERWAVEVEKLFKKVK